MQQHGPWRILKRDLKYKNPWMEVTEDQVVRPDGKEGIFGTVKMRNGVSVLPLDSEGFVYLTKEFKYAVSQETLEAVSGGIDDEENVLSAAKRELQEELGITAETWTDLGVVHPFTSLIESSAHLFLAQDLTFSESTPDGTEQIQLVKMSFEQAVEKVLKGEIFHAPSALLILKAKEHLKKK